MKKLVSAALALTLLGTVAASAQTYRGESSYGRSYTSDNNTYGGYGRDTRAYQRGGHHNSGAVIGAGIGLVALAAILASQHRDHDGWDRDRYRGWGGGWHGDRHDYRRHDDDGHFYGR